MIKLLVVLGFRSSYLKVPRVLTNFGIGPLARAAEILFGHSVLRSGSRGGYQWSAHVARTRKPTAAIVAIAIFAFGISFMRYLA